MPAIIREPQYAEDPTHDSIDYQKINTMDMTEKQSFAASANENVRDIKSKITKTKKEKEAAKAAKIKQEEQEKNTPTDDTPSAAPEGENKE